MTVYGLGVSRVTPSTVMRPSSITSSRAACVLLEVPVDFVRQKEVAQRCAGFVFQLSSRLIVYGKTGHIGGHDVRGELHPAIVQRHRLGKGQGQGGFSNAGDVLQQDMPLGKNDHEHLANDSVFSNDRFFHFLNDL